MTSPGSPWFGHEDAWREWRSAMGSGRMHHGWLLAGPRGVGKATFARAAATALVETPGAAQPEFAAHPDILLLEPLPDGETETKKREEGKPFKTKRNINVEQVRAMQRRLNTRPTLGERRAVIIDPSDDLEKGAVNALLKSLEEPPQGTFFLLIAHQPGRLLPTVRSRCRTLRFSALDEGQIDAVLLREAPQADSAARAAAIAAARGSPAGALAFLEQDLAKIHGLMLRILREGDANFALRGALAGELGTRPDRARQLATIELARATLSGELRQSARARQERIIVSHGELTRLGALAPTHNFDPGLLVMEIGGLLASAAMPREAA